MLHEPPPPTGDTPPGTPQVGDLLRDVRGAVQQSSRREPYPLLAATSAGLTALWLLWPEGGAIGAVGLKLWTVFVLCSVGLLFVPMWRERLHLAPEQAWRLAASGAGGLGFAWVAFLLPSISSNQAFFGTLAAAAAALAVDRARAPRVSDRSWHRAAGALAALLLAVSLGLPWGMRQDVVADYSSRFTIQLWNGFGGGAGYCCLQTVPTYAGGTRLVSQVVIGAQHPARFGIVAALVLLATPIVRARRWAAAVVAAELLISGSAGFTAGGVAAAWMAVLLLATSLFTSPRRLA